MKNSLKYHSFKLQIAVSQNYTFLGVADSQSCSRDTNYNM